MKRWAIVGLCTVALSGSAFSSKAEAAFPLMLEWGTAVTALAPLRPEFERELAKPGTHLAVGYKYSHAGIFLDLWTWGGEYCLSDGRGYRAISDEQARTFAAGTTPGIEPPLNYRYPYGLLLVAFVVIVGVPAMYVVRRVGDRSVVTTLR